MKIQKAWRAIAAAFAFASRSPRAADTEDHVLLPGRRGRPDHEDHRRLLRAVREGEPGHQGEARLRGHVPGIDREGAHRAQGRHAAHHGDPALHRHVHADRRRRRSSPYNDLANTADDQAWIKSFYPAFMANSQTGGKTWGIPFQRSTIVLYWNKELFKEAGPRSEQGAGQLEGDAGVRAEAHEARCRGQHDAMGRADSVVGISVLALPGAHDAQRRRAHERRRHRDLFRQARGDRGAAVLGRPRPQVQGASRPAWSSGARRRRTSSRARSR